MKRGKTLLSLLLALLLLLTQTPLRAAAADASLLDDGQEHVHSLVKIEAAQPTMSATGCLEHYRCEGCGRLFWDPDARQETDYDSVSLPTLSSGIVTVDESGIEIGGDWTVSVPVYLYNGNDAAFSGQVLVVVYEDGRYLGVDVWQIELAPGEAGQRRMELQVRPKYGNANLLELRYFVIGGDFSPMAAPEAAELPRDPETDQAIYDRALGRYAALLREAEAVSDVDERYVRMAMAEAELLDSAVMIPTTTQNGAYTISRIAPRTIPYVQWGNDDDRWFGMVISADDFLTVAERDVFWDAWNAAVAGEGEYDPAAIMESLGHGVRTDYKTTFSTAPSTIDWLNTSAQADTAITVQTVAGLVQYDNLNRLQPMLAESWEVSDDGRTYTFHVRPGVYWYTSEGEPYAELTANDFVCGFRHMLDCQAGLEWLVEGVVRGAGEYLYEGGSFENVGYAAPDRYTLVVTLEQPTSYFLTMLTYSCFLPICDSFYQSRGGVYGVEALKEARSGNGPAEYRFGRSWDVSSQVYCGPFLLQKLDPQEEIVVVRNGSFFANDKTVLDSIRWVSAPNDGPVEVFEKTVQGEYAGMGLSEGAGTLALAKERGLFDDCVYVSETTSTTYFGGLNLNRGTFALDNGAVASPKSTRQKADTQTAMQSKAFRQALQFAFDKGSYNAASRGEDLKYANLRNTYTHPEFVHLSRAVTLDGKTFPAGTFYGEIVQYYLERLGSPVLVDDQIDGWYHPEIAGDRLAQAKAELGDSVSWPITIDVVYYAASDVNRVQAQAYKDSIESTLGAENVTVNLVAAENSNDYYASGYRASSGRDGNFDVFYGSGWGPDYGDPSTYLDTFLDRGQGYMTRVIGLF